MGHIHATQSTENDSDGTATIETGDATAVRERRRH